MEQAVFEKLIARLEREEKDHPQGYRLKLLGILLFGYIVLYGTTAVLTVVFVITLQLVIDTQAGSGIVFFILAPLAALLSSIYRALWLQRSPPKGVVLRRKEAPALFQIIDVIRRRTKGPRVHTVLIDGDFNAALYQQARLGFCWYKNYMVLGLPLLTTFTEAQATAVIAHEFGHLAGAHGKFSGWLYRQAKAWTDLKTYLNRGRHGFLFLYNAFFSWYYPIFSAYSFVLRRANEYEADRLSVDIAGARETAGGLVLSRLVGRWIDERFWRDYWASTDSRPEPEPLPFSLFPVVFRKAYPVCVSPEKLDHALAVKTGVSDTHPSLKDRLAAFLASAELPPFPVRNAAEALLGDALSRVTAALDHEWKQCYLGFWKSRYEAAKRWHSRLDELDQKNTSGSRLEGEDLYEYALLTERFLGADQAKVIIQRMLELDPENADAKFARGRLMLDEGDDEGLQLLDEAVAQNGEFIYGVCNVAIPFLSERGRQQEIELYNFKAQQRTKLKQAAHVERGPLSRFDPIKQHDFSLRLLRLTQDILRDSKRVKRAWLVRKEGSWKILPEMEVYILVFQCTGFGDKWGLARQLTDSVLSSFTQKPVGLIVLPDEGYWKHLRRRMEKVDGALVFERAEKRD